jgi:hypothetical protein
MSDGLCGAIVNGGDAAEMVDKWLATMVTILPMESHSSPGLRLQGRVHEDFPATFCKDQKTKIL